MKAIKLYKLAALLLTAAAAWACTVEEYPSQMQNKVTLVTTLSPHGAVSRALSDPGDGTLTSAWAVGEEVWLYYENSASDFVETMATVTSVGSDGSATIAATLTNPKSCNASFGYPFSTYTLNQGKDIYNDQLGTLDDVSNNYNIVFGAGDIVVNGNEATLPQGVAMEHETCIWKLSFTDGSSDITPTITSLVVDDGSGSDYTVSPSGQSVIYVAMYPTASDATVTLTATTPSGVYTKTRNGITLEPGKLYTSLGVALAAAPGDPIDKAQALKENTYSVQKTGEEAQVFPFAPEFSNWYVGTSWMDGTQQAIHVELMDEDPEQMTMGWFSGEFPPEVADQLTTVDEDFCTKYKWSSAKMGTMRLSSPSMLDAHMGEGGNVKPDGRSKFWIKVRPGTKGYSGDYQFLFVFVFASQTWDQATESYIYGDEYTICGNAILKELKADLDYFSLNYSSDWAAPGQSIELTADWTAGATFDWNKVQLTSQTRLGQSGNWFTWDASTHRLYASTSADNEMVTLKFGYTGTDLTYTMSLYNGPGYTSFTVSPEIIVAENEPQGWSSNDYVYISVDSWTPDNGSSSFNYHSIELDPASDYYDKLSYNDYGPYINFSHTIPEGQFNLILRSKADHSVKCSVPVKMVRHKVTSFTLKPHQFSLYYGLTNGQVLDVEYQPADAAWDWYDLELTPGSDEHFNYNPYSHSVAIDQLAPYADSQVHGVQVGFRLKSNHKLTDYVYVDKNVGSN